MKKTKKPSMCWKCANKIIQPDLFDKKCYEVVGCKELTKKQWKHGLDGMNQKNCPIFK